MADDITIDYGNDAGGSGSYFTRQFGQPINWNPNIDQRMGTSLMTATPGNPGSEIDLSGMNGGVNDAQPDQINPYGIDLSTLQYIRGGLDRVRNTPPSEQLRAEDFYPLGDEPVAVGQFSGPLFGGNVYSAGAPEIPYAMLYAKQRARKAEEDAYNAKLNQQVNYELAHVKSAIQDRVFVEQQQEDWTNWLNEQYDKLRKSNISPEYWTDVITKSQGYKNKIAQWNNVAATFDPAYDRALTTVQAYNNQINGKTDQADNTSPYVSRYTYELSQEFLNKLGKEKIDVDDLATYNFDQRYRYAQNMDNLIDEYATTWNKKETSAIEEAKKNGKWIRTNKNDVYSIRNVTGVDPDSKETKADIKAIYDRTYGRETDKRIVPDFETEFYPAFKDKLYNTEKQVIKEIDKFDPFEWAELAWKQKQSAPTTITPNTKQFLVTGKDGKQYTVKWTGDITTSDGKAAKIPVSGNTGNVAFDPTNGSFDRSKIVGKAAIVGYGNVPDPSGNEVKGVRILGVDANGKVREEWQYASNFAQPIQEWEADKNIAQPVDNNDPIVTTEYQRVNTQPGAVFTVEPQNQQSNQTTPGTGGAY